jgi:hypothetical protein
MMAAVADDRLRLGRVGNLDSRIKKEWLEPEPLTVAPTD